MIVRPISLMLLHGNCLIWIPESITAKNKVCMDVILRFNDTLKVSCTLLIGYFIKHNQTWTFVIIFWSTFISKLCSTVVCFLCRSLNIDTILACALLVPPKHDISSHLKYHLSSIPQDTTIFIWLKCTKSLVRTHFFSRLCWHLPKSIAAFPWGHKTLCTIR